ncbi:MAG: biotin--acetyl-CoA-carboxylase ligase [Gammaproteobacteria bacterium]|jgi:BirA family biotin operon repressor/biotin-[acetyl-CoA-carboxylase] ligase|nr:biotin--acetyl-CoA-carboxylase ligase [Gammaproteobacteria bacterium]
MTPLKKLLKILSDGKCHSGAALGEELGITRAAIWKLVQQLKDWNIEIEAKTNQGYCIPGGMELLEVKKILDSCQVQKIDQKLIKVFDVLPSTNTYLVERVREGIKDTQICLAEFQTQGRGRFGRQWVSAFGKNIYFSMLWTFHGDLSRLAGLSLVVALAVTRALKAYGIEEGIGLKWPNDVHWLSRKLAGILIELHAESHHVSEVVIGIGVNGELSPALRNQTQKSVIDIVEITGKAFARNHFVGLLMTSLMQVLAQFQEEGLKPFVSEWLGLDVVLNQPVQLILGTETINGIYRGIDFEHGDLLLEDDQGKLRRYSGGEVSLRMS